MNKVEEIFKAWNIAFNPNSEQAELASKRIEICNSCEHKVTNLGVNRCSVCGCALKGKVFSPVKGACPKGKWNQVDELIEKDIEITPEDTIFIQIASYRDPQLVPTLNDLFFNADHPDNLRVCIAWQHSEEDLWDNLGSYSNDPRVVIIDIPYKDSKGACWARNTIQKQYTNEKYTLQLDSHHRFIKGWDTTLISMFQRLKNKGIEKPLLTSYIPSFDPDNDPQGRGKEPWWMTFDRFTPEGVVFFLPARIPNWEVRTDPVPARFYSAHFAFTTGKFCLEVSHDPEFYFHGEEISIAVRAFTHGYDLYHPHKVIAWHEYTRKGRTKHWDDSPDWGERNIKSYQKLKQLLGTDGTKKVDFKKYGLGSKRTLEEYESYSGIRFLDRNIQQWTLDNKYPPNPSDDVYRSKFKHILDLRSEWFREKEYSGLGIFFEKNDGTQIHRVDLSKKQFTHFLKSETFNYTVEFIGDRPDKWVVWAFSDKGWHERIERRL